MILDKIDIFAKPDKLSYILCNDIRDSMSYIGMLCKLFNKEDLKIIDPYDHLNTFLGIKDYDIINLVKLKSGLSTKNRFAMPSLKSFNGKILIVINMFSDTNRTLTKFIDEYYPAFDKVIMFDYIINYTKKENDKNIIAQTGAYYKIWKNKINPTAIYALDSTNGSQVKYIHEVYPYFQFF